MQQPGRLFTFDDYYSQEIKPYRFLVTHSIPAYVNEFSINEHFNANFLRSYSVSTDTENRFVGKDVVSANQKFVAHLMLDLEKLIEVVRIYYRNETRFAYGHTDIELKDFTVDVSSIHFLGNEDSHSFFVKNAFIGNLYAINDLELVINTKKYNTEYHKYINQTYQLNIMAYNIEQKNNSVTTKFNITFADQDDMSSYFIGSTKQLNYIHGYGDQSFSEIVSNNYMGPDLKFGHMLKPGSDGYDLVIPNITATKELSVIRDLTSDSNCTDSFFNRFTDPNTGVENIAFY